MGLDCPSVGSPVRCLLRIVLSARVLTTALPRVRLFLSVSVCVFDVEDVRQAGGLVRVRQGFATSVRVKVAGLNCSVESPVRLLSRLVLSVNWLTSGLPCKGILFMAELSGTPGVGVVGIPGLVGSLLSDDSGLLSLLSVCLGQLEAEEKER